MSNSTTHTFWKLIKSCRVVIPKLQRDYAQGRENAPAIEQIRNSLIEEIYSAVTDKKPLVLNFIYGAKQDDLFQPIDGQQRLTTLFLLHWYVFLRTEFTEGLIYLKDFSYETRDTSKRFCSNICDITIDFSKEKISSQIEECYWLTSNFEMDPTIKSMLVVMDSLHEKFKDIADFNVIKERLIEDECPISFLWLEMPNFQQTNDLYIKMNARGKLLSDFEIFKAKLQNSEMLVQILGEKTTEKDKIIFISKYNNQYAEFFYKIFQEEYDNALMNFIKSTLRDSYLCMVSRCGVPQKIYRNDYGKLKPMSGNVFFRFIENGGIGYEQCQNPQTAFIDGLKRVDDLLRKLNSMTNPLVFENTLTKHFYDEKDLFKKNHTRDNLEEDVVRYALYSFIYKFGIPDTYEQKNAYSMWKRFIYNILTNSAFESRREDIVEAFVFIENIIENIASYDESSLLNTLSSLKADKCTAAIRFQMKEEIIKAGLIKDASWKKHILDAEFYFTDGQIGFLLEFAKKSDGTYDISEFEKYDKCLRKIFDSNKRINSAIPYITFEQALLCMEDKTTNKTGHLLKQSNSTTSWGFVGKNYKELLKNSTEDAKKRILRALIDKVVSAVDIESELKQIVASMNKSHFTDPEKWKIPFIKNNYFDVFMGEFQFKNCVNLEKANKEILMMSGTTVRLKSMELNTFLLYRELQDSKIKCNLVLYATGTMRDIDNFPTRYIEIKYVNVGYTGDDSSKPFVWKENGMVQQLTKDEVIQKAKTI